MAFGAKKVGYVVSSIGERCGPAFGRRSLAPLALLARPSSLAGK